MAQRIRKEAHDKNEPSCPCEPSRQARPRIVHPQQARPRIVELDQARSRIVKPRQVRPLIA